MTKRRGIRKRVIVSVTILIVVSFALLGVALSSLIYKNEKEELMSLERELVGYAANEMLWDIHELSALLGFSALNYDVSRQNGFSEAGFLSQVLSSEHVKHNNIVDELSFIGNTGRERARVSRTTVFSGKDLRNFAKADEFAVPLKTGLVYFGPVSFESATFEPHMTMSLPIQDVASGVVQAVLIGRIRLNRIWENAVERSVGETGIIFITDDTGKVLAHPDPSVIYLNTFYTPESPEGFQRGLNGERVMLVSRKVDVGNRTFFVYASMPLREVIGLSLKTLSVMAVFLIGFVFFSIAVCLVAVNRIIGPIESLAANARNISAGQMFTPVRVEDGDEIGDMSSAFNIMTSRLLESIDSLEARNVLLNNIMNSLTHPFYVIDAGDYTIKLANPAAGFSDQSEARTCYALTHQKDKPCSDSEHPCVIELIRQEKKPVVVEHVHYDEQGKPLIVEIHGYPIFDKDHNVIQVIEYIFDITARKKMEEDLHVSEQKNRTITATAKDAIIMVDENDSVLFWNPAAEMIFGYSEEEVLGRELHDLIGSTSYREAYLKGLETFRQTGAGAAVGQTIEMKAKKKDGTEFPVELSLSAFLVKDRWCAVGIARDITQRKLAEDKMIESLREKELLLQEIHHRVKNNMQVIASLLDLQLGFVQGRQPQEIFSDIKNRIKSMALVHERLYLSKDLTKIDFHDYLETLISNLYRFYNVSMARVVLKLEVSDIAIGIDTAIPCGLIVNELITNALKYAFPGDRAGELGVLFRKTGESDEGRELFEMTVQDNGIGMPEDLDLKGVKTLGLYLVTTLAEHQLQGTIELNRTNGTGFRIRFRELKYKKRL
ncbi:MAG: PAS domain S-box protein [Nitrospirae bacterium]|nr:PAS domain S-box protein [Nitrospirota bacterium]